jgi:DNA invertase Pin-like site-specific DNA recombinase
MMITTIFEE